MNKRELLEQFGQLLMHDVRDKAIWRCNALATGHLKGERAAKLASASAKLVEPAQREAVLALIPEFVDSVIFQFLFMIDDQEEVDLLLTTETGERVSLKESSDGLAGELFNQDGWIALYSQQRHNER